MSPPKRNNNECGPKKCYRRHGPSRNRKGKKTITGKKGKKHQQRSDSLSAVEEEEDDMVVESDIEADNVSEEEDD